MSDSISPADTVAVPDWIADLERTMHIRTQHVPDTISLRRLCRQFRELSAIVADLRQDAGDVYLVVERIEYDGERIVWASLSRAEAILKAEELAAACVHGDDHSYIVERRQGDDREEVTVRLAPGWSLCGRCQGRGRYSSPPGIEAILEQEFAESAPTLSGSWMHCQACNGTGRVRDRADLTSPPVPLLDAAQEEVTP
jgi:hypothetical protein